MILIANKYYLPDKCPADCSLRPKVGFYQGCTCMRCPVLNCVPDDDGFCILKAEDFREDWAAEWDLFFKDGTPPVLKLSKSED
jgi:hypothetical protein